MPPPDALDEPNVWALLMRCCLLISLSHFSKEPHRRPRILMYLRIRLRAFHGPVLHLRQSPAMYLLRQIVDAGHRAFDGRSGSTFCPNGTSPFLIFHVILSPLFPPTYPVYLLVMEYLLLNT
ncbi:hypothetical protein DFH09DRAFT_1327167 [Mycena vulgaris]|nr:hypothetical protein DFH09DRAFT_1327167 [Mycena vulgaris]